MLLSLSPSPFLSKISRKKKFSFPDSYCNCLLSRPLVASGDICNAVTEARAECKRTRCEAWLVYSLSAPVLFTPRQLACNSLSHNNHWIQTEEPTDHLIGSSSRCDWPPATSLAQQPVWGRD
uniref:Uncharacterized protein n=1 Tax=Molossus molossus TaxID=27622 RepID=A0A7J8DCC1_MOLMO|nr:hypothetical protein HJG59_009368 [Molossus molossus]